MLSTLRKLATARFPPASFPFALLGVCLLSYGLLIPTLGFYWDDFPITWIAERMGADGLKDYFYTNRPVWGLVYQLTTPLLGSEPVRWQVFALIWRWLATVALWSALRLAWPHSLKLAATVSLLFLVYPGFTQQFISLVYSHFFIVLAAFFTSLSCTLLALRKPRYSWPLTIRALLLSLLNLLSMEYFFLLELLRPALVWSVLSRSIPGRKEQFRKTVIAWLPYLAVFLGAATWRLFFFPFQTYDYKPVLFENLTADPIQALLNLGGLILASLWTTVVAAWGQPFNLAVLTETGSRSVLVYTLLVICTGLFVLLYLLRLQGQKETEGAYPAWKTVLFGVFTWIIAGWPVWVLEFGPSLSFPSDRFNLPLMLGSCIILAGLIAALPFRNWGRSLVLAIILAFTAGFQFQTANTYRHDWETFQRFFWQMSWRIPQLEPGTTIVTNDLPLSYYSDNSLSAPLNWIYAPESRAGEMPYMLLYPSARLGTKLPSLVKGEAISVDYLAADFTGDTSQVVALYYDPPACLRILDPRLDGDNLMLPPLMRHAATLSTTEPNLGADETGDVVPVQLPDRFFGSEPDHSWCYYFERADLARQAGDWERAAALGDQAFALGDYPNDPSERIPFIEAYAHTGNWERALELTGEAQAVTPAMEPVLCHVWDRIAGSTPSTPDKEASVKTAYDSLGCPRK